MDRRARDAREKSLKELKRQRLEGTMRRDDSSDDEIDIRDFLLVHASDEEFIEYAPEVEEDAGSEGGRKAGSRPAISRQDAAVRREAIDVRKDEYFRNILAQLDDPSGQQQPPSTDPVAAEMDWDEPMLPDFPVIPPVIDAIGARNEWLATSEADRPRNDRRDTDPSSCVSETDLRRGDESKVLFYWIDAYERPNGTVFLFGLSSDNGQLKSACVQINNIQRNVYLLPRPHILSTSAPNSMDAVRSEVDALLARHGIHNATVRKVVRNYAFEVPGVPNEADWIKIAYGFGQRAIAATPGDTFSHVFGTTSSALETLIVKRRVMGPGWLAVRPCVSGKKGVSWCQLEFEVATPKHVIFLQTQPPAPDLTVLSLSIRSLNGEIVAASGVVFKQVPLDSYCSQKAPSGAFAVVREEGAAPPATLLSHYGPKGRLEVAKSERSLLSYLLAVVHRWDPDAIIGYNFWGADLSLLLHRLRLNGVSNWSRLGRLNWSHWPKGGRAVGDGSATHAERQIMSGRLVCDTLLGAREHVRSKDYSLATLVESQLGEVQAVSAMSTTDPSLVESPAIARIGTVRSAETDAYLQAQLTFRLHLLSLSKQLTNIAGNVWNRTLAGARAERNEYLFLHEFHNLKYVLPEKRTATHLAEDLANSDDEGASSSRRKPAYSGGLVLEPKRGLYTSVVMLLDFNSLYPSLIQEFNICFTTVHRDYSSNTAADCDDDNGDGSTDHLPSLPDPHLPSGVLPKIISNLVQRRRQVKSLMKDGRLSAEERQQLNIRQQALKLTANSMYGCLGFAHSRFYARPLAALITAKGREVLRETVEVARGQLGLDVIYGDTDSVMIDTRLSGDVIEKVRALATAFKRAVNERYKCLEIELDGMFGRLLLLRKKKYAAAVLSEDGVTSKLETKGLDMVRRDWSRVSVDACNYCLQQIMSLDHEDPAPAIGRHLRELSAALESGSVPLRQFVICKNLAKDPSLYSDVKGQPHVAVALKARERGDLVQAGTTIQYVICKPCNAGPALAERAYSIDEMQRDPSLTVDKEWYIQQQLIPPLARICEFVKGVDSLFLAGCFGLDTRRYAAAHYNYPSHPQMASPKPCFPPLCFTCPACSKQFSVGGTDHLTCAHCSSRLSVPAAACQLIAIVRRLQSDLYQQWAQCDECQTATRTTRMYPQRCPAEDCSGTMALRVPLSFV